MTVVEENAKHSNEKRTKPSSGSGKLNAIRTPIRVRGSCLPAEGVER